jgi:hypothetical protein
MAWSGEIQRATQTLQASPTTPGRVEIHMLAALQSTNFNGT